MSDLEARVKIIVIYPTSSLGDLKCKDCEYYKLTCNCEREMAAGCIPELRYSKGEKMISVEDAQNLVSTVQEVLKGAVDRNIELNEKLERIRQLIPSVKELQDNLSLDGFSGYYLNTVSNILNVLEKETEG